jgi:fumarylacetoacetate (FAA) hydrolase
MKLATYQDASRDGQLVVVSRDLSLAHYASGVSGRLQQVLDDWNFLSPQLEEISQTLNHGKARHAFAFEPEQCMAPLPRAYRWVGGSAYRRPAELVRQASGAEMPESQRTEPLVYQGGSDDLAGPRDAIRGENLDHGIDFEAQLAVITGDVAIGTAAEAAIDSIRLLVLANDVTLRHLAAAELAKGLGFYQSKPATAFSPVAVTPDELLHAWHGGRVHLNLESVWNGKRVGLCAAGDEMHFHFGELIAHLAKTRQLRAGSIVGSGPVSNADPSRGYSCIAEKRAIEAIEGSASKTDFMQVGDTVRIEMKGLDGASVFGAIEQTVVAVS